jgi:hypothetical protein
MSPHADHSGDSHDPLRNLGGASIRRGGFFRKSGENFAKHRADPCWHGSWTLAARVSAALRLTVLLFFMFGGRAFAQDLEPRTYSANPVGTNFLLAGYGYTWGDVALDPSLPLSDVSAKIHTGILGYSRSFGLLGRQASAAALLPIFSGKIDGLVVGEARSVTRDGLGDPRLRFAVNLLGGAALSPAEFAKREPTTTLGTSLTVVVPLGEYDSEKLVNIGSNRWAFKPELGLSHPFGPFSLDLYGGAWVFTENGDFFNDQKREQAPLYTTQIHGSYTILRRLWVAADGTFYEGGRTTVDGKRSDDRQENSRVGVTLALPLGAHESLKLAWSRGVTTRNGGDFDSVAIAFQLFWFDRP